MATLDSLASSDSKNPLSYAQSGVDRASADQLVEKISVLTRGTLNKKVKAAVGGYASLYEIDKKRWIAASTDGVGTKLKLAFQLKDHRTIGIDLVAMSVNDILCVGAEPMFFLDYFATGKLDNGVAEQVLSGIVEGCKQARCALVGGETAEMPEFYHPGEYDLGGFAVGMVEPKRVLPRAREIAPGDELVGIASSGCHSNGYSLLRKLLDRSGEKGAQREARARELLTPTRIYVKALSPFLSGGGKNAKLGRLIKGLAHITGSGYLNVPRMSDKVSYAIELPPTSEVAPIYRWVRDQSRLPMEELAQTFNLGVGMVAVVPPGKSAEVIAALKKSGEKAWAIGQVTRRRKGAGSEVTVSQDGETTVLKYS